MLINRTLIGFFLSCFLAPAVAAGLDSAGNGEAARLYFEEIINHQKVELIPVLIADDFAPFNNGKRVGQTGPQVVRKAIEDHEKANTEYAFHVKALYEADDKVIVQWLWQSINIKFGPPRPVSAHGISIFEFRDGKISSLWQVFDVLGFMQQLDFTLTPPQNPNEESPANQ